MFKEFSVVLCTMSLCLVQDVVSVPLRNNDKPISQWSGQINGFDIDRSEYVPIGTNATDIGNGMGSVSNSSNSWISGATSGANNGMGSVSNSSSGWMNGYNGGPNNGMGSVSNSSNGWMNGFNRQPNNGMGSVSNSGSGWMNGFNGGPNNGMGSVPNSSSGWVSSFSNGSNNGMQSGSNSGNGWDNGFSNGMGTSNIMGDEQWTNRVNSMSLNNRTNAGVDGVQNQANKYSNYPSMYYQQYSQSFVVPTQGTAEDLQTPPNANGQNEIPPTTSGQTETPPSASGQTETPPSASGIPDQNEASSPDQMANNGENLKNLRRKTLGSDRYQLIVVREI
ncbi:hyphally regulated cell wall protein 3-like isoform X2 [Bradysia coprophila]|uniref:hyphally regulated cell wall protein 3-like isoform X2 n=1 Tax=Bradysia coprophila TaxID=38358 RepID=UPI00187D7462|nr:hyphally regulated cell wall protein 3-like isoform X2 [Bradysia coprophila]